MNTIKLKTSFLGQKKPIIQRILQLLLAIYGSCPYATATTRPLSKAIYDQQFLGEAQSNTAAYSDVCEEHRPASTPKLPSEIEFRKRSKGTLPIKEIIIGVSNKHKQALQKHSIYQPNVTFLGMPIEKWLYQWGKNHFNPEKIKNEIAAIQQLYAYRISKATSEKEKTRLAAKRDKLIQRKEFAAVHGNRLMRMGEKPLYYDPMYVRHNEKIFLNYLHSKGYLDAEVTSKTDIQKKIVRVTYYIKQQNLYKIASTSLQVAYKPIRDLLASHSGESFIKIDAPYGYQDFVNEQERIVNLLADNGYFEFDEQYVYFKADLSKNDHTIGVTTIVGVPESTVDKTKIGRIIVDLTTQKQHQSNAGNLQTKVCQGLFFLVPSDGYPLDDLASKIPLRPGDFYNKSKILETYERLYRIATFESIAILPKIEAGELVIYIHAKPYERVRLQTEFGGECINLDLKRLRPTIKLNPTIRRVGGLGLLNIEASIALREEFITKTAANLSQNITYGLRGKFTTPRFILCLPRKTNLMLENFNPSTTIDIGYSFTKNAIYNSKKIDAMLNYDWYSKHVAYQLSPFKVAFDYPQVVDATKISQLKTKLRLPSLLTSIGCIATIRAATPTLYLNSLERYKWMVSIGIEHGGLYEHLALFKKILPKPFEVYKYIKIDIGYRHAFNLTPYTTLAYQAKLGTARGYTATDKVHPDKQYAIGGYGSVRAWDKQMIGPGVYEGDKKEERKGDLLLLGNIELRRKLIGYLEGALFLDIGNTWRLSKNEPSAMQFYLDKFYKAFAIGGGFGLRLNFYNTFVLCGDLAFPLHRPSGKKIKKLEPFFNLAIGYPF
ncbi:MAG: BamA/TamA family outer membrane protein [Candidatus Cardinium sp.]|uniref:BamA/TamA family outer membrane protein n=1 Tax=Cardinium endosymbiont of Dermatophagoides farinae TaxID=2597823 RepID=UPI0016427C1F|nr:BamA/TamA family outer membrane protein [Cardinium endosymbiont of Dermatophagoides farinae]UWW97366.1 MAG: BamA/TamA family outer membrane protein [Candidatus Cardinium sp.]